MKRDVPGTSRPSFVSSVRRRSGSGASRVSRSSSTRGDARNKREALSKIAGESIRRVSFKPLFAIKRVVSRSLLAPRKHFRFPFLWPSLLENPASRQTNHDETTVFPRPQRETRERYAPATTTMTRPTDVDRHLPDCLHAVTRASRSITPRVADPSPSSRGRRAKHRRAATRDRPTENHADR